MEKINASEDSPAFSPSSSMKASAELAASTPNILLLIALIRRHRDWVHTTTGAAGYSAEGQKAAKTSNISWGTDVGGRLISGWRACTTASLFSVRT